MRSDPTDRTPHITHYLDWLQRTRGLIHRGATLHGHNQLYRALGFPFRGADCGCRYRHH